METVACDDSSEAVTSSFSSEDDLLHQPEAQDVLPAGSDQEVLAPVQRDVGLLLQDEHDEEEDADDESKPELPSEKEDWDMSAQQQRGSEASENGSDERTPWGGPQPEETQQAPAAASKQGSRYDGMAAFFAAQQEDDDDDVDECRMRLFAEYTRQLEEEDDEEADAASFQREEEEGAEELDEAADEMTEDFLIEVADLEDMVVEGSTGARGTVGSGLGPMSPPWQPQGLALPMEAPFTPEDIPPLALGRLSSESVVVNGPSVDDHELEMCAAEHALRVEGLLAPTPRMPGLEAVVGAAAVSAGSAEHDDYYMEESEEEEDVASTEETMDTPSADDDEQSEHAPRNSRSEEGEDIELTAVAPPAASQRDASTTAHVASASESSPFSLEDDKEDEEHSHSEEDIVGIQQVRMLDGGTEEHHASQPPTHAHDQAEASEMEKLEASRNEEAELSEQEDSELSAEEEENEDAKQEEAAGSKRKEAELCEQEDSEEDVDIAKHEEAEGFKQKEVEAQVLAQEDSEFPEEEEGEVSKLEEAEVSEHDDAEVEEVAEDNMSQPRGLQPDAAADAVLASAEASEDGGAQDGQALFMLYRSRDAEVHVGELESKAEEARTSENLLAEGAVTNHIADAEQPHDTKSQDADARSEDSDASDGQWQEEAHALEEDALVDTDEDEAEYHEQERALRRAAPHLEEAEPAPCLRREFGVADMAAFVAAHGGIAGEDSEEEAEHAHTPPRAASLQLEDAAHAPLTRDVAVENMEAHIDDNADRDQSEDDDMDIDIDEDESRRLFAEFGPDPGDEDEDSESAEDVDVEVDESDKDGESSGGLADGEAELVQRESPVSAHVEMPQEWTIPSQQQEIPSDSGSDLDPEESLHQEGVAESREPLEDSSHTLAATSSTGVESLENQVETLAEAAAQSASEEGCDDFYCEQSDEEAAGTSTNETFYTPASDGPTDDATQHRSLDDSSGASEAAESITPAALAETDSRDSASTGECDRGLRHEDQHHLSIPAAGAWDAPFSRSEKLQMLLHTLELERAWGHGKSSRTPVPNPHGDAWDTPLSQKEKVHYMLMMLGAFEGTSKGGRSRGSIESSEGCSATTEEI